jgi:uncharacterized protein affecting Mg2+/Co2+ transport
MIPPVTHHVRHNVKLWGRQMSNGCRLSWPFSLTKSTITTTVSPRRRTGLAGASSRRFIRRYYAASPQTLEAVASSNPTNAAAASAKAPLIRLYRILLKQCRLLAQNSDNGVPVLLQSPLNPHNAGLSTTFPSSLNKDITPEHVLCFFEAFRTEEILDALERAPEGTYPEPTTDSDDDSHWTEEQRLLIAEWLPPHIANTDIKEDDDWTSSPDAFETLWTTPDTIQQAIRLAFANSLITSTLTTQQYTAWAIKAYQYLTAQTEMQRLMQWRQDPSGIRITCLARCVGRAMATSTPSPQRRHSQHHNKYKYRFVYRIRMENVTTDQHFQLLGRSWIIQEEPAIVPPSTTAAIQGSEASGSRTQKGLVFGDASTSIKVHAPQTGAVGKHPVLQPGQVFEYMSGCDLATERGEMKGSFHFAVVPPGTPSATVGQFVAALSNDDNSMTDKRFEVPVKPFSLEPDQLPVRYEA